MWRSAFDTVEALVLCPSRNDMMMLDDVPCKELHWAQDPSVCRKYIADQCSRKIADRSRRGLLKCTIVRSLAGTIRLWCFA